jgi:acetolactate synthase-1/2/3 large subunit
MEIEPIRLGNEEFEGENRAYLLASGDTIALVDTGIAYANIREELASALAALGYEFGDVDQVDVDPEVFGRHVEPAVPVLGDARTTETLAERVTRHPDRTENVRDRIAAAGSPRDVEFATDPDRVDPREATLELSDRLPDGTLVAVDSGNNTGFPAVFHDIEGDGRMLVNGNFGSMGYALPAALGAQLGAPDRTVVC